MPASVRSKEKSQTVTLFLSNVLPTQNSKIRVYKLHHQIQAKQDYCLFRRWNIIHLLVAPEIMLTDKKIYQSFHMPTLYFIPSFHFYERAYRKMRCQVQNGNFRKPCNARRSFTDTYTNAKCC